MAENIARDTQYQYKATASLVLQQDRSSIPNRTKEPTGEPETLWGKYDPKQMGDRAQRALPDEELGRMAASKQRQAKNATGLDVNGAKGKSKKLSAKERITSSFGARSVLDAVDDFEGLTYRPKTREAKDAYSLILHFTSVQLGDQSQEILRSATDEVLAILKNGALKDFDKKKEIEYIVGEQLPAEKFNQLINLGKKITDYSGDDNADASKDQSSSKAEDAMDEDVGVAVVFDEEEEEDIYEINEDDEEDEEDDEEPADGPAGIPKPDNDAASELEDEEETLVVRGAADTAKTLEASRSSDQLSPLEIDAFWLQRTVSTYFPDAHTSQEITSQIMDILKDTTTARDCENALVQLLNYGNFDLVKLATKNRELICWCTRLARAGPRGEEREAVEAEAVEAGFSWILQALKTGIAEGATPEQQRESEQQGPRKRQQTMAEQVAALAPEKLLDLDAMAFAQGAHLMTNKKCELPAGSFKSTHKSYEEVTVPAPKPQPMGPDESLVSITSLPEWTQPAFKSAKCLNRVQSRVYQTAFETDENLLICAPTGAGKTNVAMLTMLRAMSRHRNPETGHIDRAAFKMVYIAPMKALVQEVVGNFGKRLTDDFGIRVAELTGDRQLTKQQIAETQLIVTTPEKWDIITRKAHDRSYTQLVSLVIIDEVHLLHDDRGPVLEAIVSRTVRQIEATNRHVRLVGLSATLPNYHDVAAFMRVDRQRGLFHFDNSYRPCPLQQHYIGVTERKVSRRVQLMNEICYERCAAAAGKNQVLVFVHSRKETAKTARAIRDLAVERETIAQFLRQNSASREILQAEAETVKNSELQALLPYGFACHHAGMTRGDRQVVEELFADGHVQVLVSTATLAWGVNLPAHTVIIKGTQVYSPERGAWVELSPQDVLQMLGRAGRPQYDTHGEGIIITAHRELQFYLSLLNVQLPIESQLISKLPDTLNAEVVLGTVKSRQEAAEWLRSTYLYVRMLRQPEVYGITAEEASADPRLDRRLLELAHAALLQLDRAQLVKYDHRRAAAGRLQVTELGRIAAHYYVSHRSMLTYNQHLRPGMGLMELLRVFSLSDEFRHVAVRDEELVELQKLCERVPIPVKDGPETAVSKINVLLQAYISRLRLDGFALVADMVYVTQSAGRLVRALFEICLKRQWARLARVALQLCQMVQRRVWLSMSPLRQFTPGLNPDLLRRLEKKEFPWQRMYDLNPQELGELVRNPKAGKLLHRLTHQFPRLDVETRLQPITRSLLNIDLTLTPAFEWDAESSTNSEMFWVLVEDCDQERILFADQFLLRRQYAADAHQMSFTVPLHEPLPPNYFLSVVSDRWLHAETRLPISFKHLLLPAKFPPHTELLDLQPLPVSSLDADLSIENIFTARNWRHFNAIQTQCFQALHHGDSNVFVGAPHGSGKTALAELAILRQWNKEISDDDKKQLIVYVAPRADQCRQRCLQWQRCFSSRVVSQLTGETSADLKLMSAADLVVATPQQWDSLSRRWKQRRTTVQQVALLIVDDVHMLASGSDETAAAMEVCISRIRFMASQLDRQVRLVALGASLASARDLGDWLGCPSDCVFNFHPSTRPVPVEIHMQSFSVPHFASLMLAMARPVFTGVAQHCGTSKQQAVVFCHSPKQTRDTAAQLVEFSVAEGSARKFLHLPDCAPFNNDDEEETVERQVRLSLGPLLAETITDQRLQLAIAHGIGYVNEGQPAAVRAAVMRLYQRGIVQVLVASRELAYALFDSATGAPLTAHMVAIMGTQHYNGREHRYVDYSVAEVLQMTSMAGTQGGQVTDDNEFDDGSAVAPVMFLCPANKKEFYKKFLHDGLPIESHLEHQLPDHFNAEIVTKTIESKQDAVDYLTWTFLYRRMAQNPNYYNLVGVSHRHLSDHLSELVESTMADLATSKCIAIDEQDDTSVTPLNLGMIAAYYYINYLTIEIFSMSLTSSTKLRGLLEIVTAATEFDSLPIRHHEDVLLSRIYDRCPVKAPAGTTLKFTDPHVKANLLVQSHFSRLQLPADLTADLNDLLLPRLIPLIYAAVDVLSSSGWLAPAMAAMELCQMVVQAMWGDRDSTLRQIPHFDVARIELAKQHGVETVFDLIEIEEESVRNLILAGLTPAQVGQVAAVANRYPNIDLAFSLSSSTSTSETENADGLKSITVSADDTAVQVHLQLSRDSGEDGDAADEPVGPVIAPFFPSVKEEGWWLVVGDPKTKQLHSIKRLTLQSQFQYRMELAAPSEPGTYMYKLYFMCDSWIGCDQEYEFEVRVEATVDAMDDSA